MARIRYLKENPKGVEEMCAAMDEIRKDVEKRSDMKNNVVHIRDMMASLGISVEKAMDVIHISPELRADVALLVKF